MPFQFFVNWEFQCEECSAVHNEEMRVALGADLPNPPVPDGWCVLEESAVVYKCYCPDHWPGAKQVNYIEVNPQKVRAKFPLVNPVKRA